MVSSVASMRQAIISNVTTSLRTERDVQENSNQQLEMHIRIKRAKTVLFLYVDPSETIRDVKNKIEALLGQVSCLACHWSVQIAPGESQKFATSCC